MIIQLAQFHQILAEVQHEPAGWQYKRTMIILLLWQFLQEQKIIAFLGGCPHCQRRMIKGIWMHHFMRSQVWNIESLELVPPSLHPTSILIHHGQATRQPSYLPQMRTDLLGPANVALLWWDNIWHCFPVQDQPRSHGQSLWPSTHNPEIRGEENPSNLEKSRKHHRRIDANRHIDRDRQTFQSQIDRSISVYCICIWVCLIYITR